MKNIIVIILFIILGYTGFQTYQTHLANSELIKYEDMKKIFPTRADCHEGFDSCKISPSCSGKCFKYKNFIDDIWIKYLKTHYWNEILCVLSFLLIIVLIIKLKKKNTI